jgi:protein-tyrosine-phosphatase
MDAGTPESFIWRLDDRFHETGSHGTGDSDLLRKLNYDVASLRCKNWAEFSRPEAPKLDFVFTLCDDAEAEVCPVWPGQPMTAHWGLPDPATAAGKVAEVRLARLSWGDTDDCRSTDS